MFTVDAFLLLSRYLQLLFKENYILHDKIILFVRGTFGPCSTTCPGGQSFRYRVHSCTNQRESDVIPCGPPGTYGDWSPWSACSNTCNGVKTRRRFHTCGLAPEVGTEACGTGGKSL